MLLCRAHSHYYFLLKMAVAIAQFGGTNSAY